MVDVGGYRAQAREALVKKGEGRRRKSPPLGRRGGTGADERL